MIIKVPHETAKEKNTIKIRKEKREEKAKNKEKGKGEGNIQHPIYPTHSWALSGHANKSAK